MKKHFSGLSPRAFQHPLDRAALSALERVPGLDWVIRQFLSAIGERRLRIFYLASAVRVGENQCADVFSAYTEACAILDIKEDNRPELFIAQNPNLNAMAVGVDKPFIVINSSIIELLDRDELQCVLAHELGHVLCGHALYTTMLTMLLNTWSMFIGIPGGYLVIRAIMLALLEWSRKSELSSDRAGLLVAQDPQVSYRVEMKLAAGKIGADMNIDAFLQQAQEYEEYGDLGDGVLKLANLLHTTHLFPVLRVAEQKKWVDTGDYLEILKGNYTRRGESSPNSWIENIKASASEYKENMNTSSDPFLSSLRDVGGGAAHTAQQVMEMLKKAME